MLIFPPIDISHVWKYQVFEIRRSEPLVGRGGRLVAWVEGDHVQVGAVHLDVAARRVHRPQQV